ncbi:progranulin-like isoform X2 [Physella acuta]|uniref:progranulin-like isoform X2 n=1 Tax=Physella acuta TaxID=109671 RepID=UPI0027DD2F73|nr:progranulin-like isoform X2 [Physella acuta]
MFLRCSLLLLCLSHLAFSRNLQQQNKNVLYFQAHGVREAVHFSVNLPNGTCPNNTAYFCSVNYTCCKTPQPTNPYACCPYLEGDCCPDGIHCCPRGTRCDMVRRGCVYASDNENESTFVEWDTMSPVQLLTSEKTPENVKVVCPGGQSQCPDGTTCCKMQSGDYGCCPYSKAVCCSDHTHCCPNGYTCDVSAGTCNRGNDVVAWLTKQPAKTVGEVKCDGSSSCPDGNTCCKLASGEYGCCPLPKAVCCSDHTHCCPNGYTCDVSAGTCNRGNDVVAWLTKQPAKTVGEVKCDGSSSCPDGNTCCKLASGEYGCCPLPKAVCCSDHTHCCPNGYTCDVSAGTCNRGNDVVAWLTKQPAKTVGEVKCDGSSSCPDGNTCCKLASGEYGCCPLPKAVCCSDHTHCCPNGYTCDVSAGTCNRGNDVVAWLTKQPAKTVGEVKCDDSSSCPDGNTCCKLASGEYGCCPLPKAVCCSDHTHCCPNGYTCDVSAGTCNRGNDVVAWLTKQPAKTVGEVKCDDSSSCPDGNTCCKLASGEYGCCPLPKAVCCSDHTHCCPNGYTCDVSAGTCNRGNDVVAWLTKQPAKTVGEVKCDDSSSCPDGNTCCKLASGEYGCCPLPKAVCCNDHTHCCPNGYTCDVSAGTCNRGNDVVAWLTKQPAKTVGEVKCDDSSSCPDGNTCCKLASGEYGCCPLPKAVCCSDHTHCCPNGYTCDVSAGTCNRGNDVVAWLTKQPAKTVGEVKCDDSSSCPDGNTCCKLASGEYGCCPLPKAVCCSDHTHCCPNGYTCDVSAGTCNRGNDVVAWLTKQPAKTVGEVKCDDSSSCPDGNTCCKLASGEYGCCPLPKAVCCSDHTHCCPNGYTCDVSAGTCNRGNEVISWFAKKLAN